MAHCISVSTHAGGRSAWIILVQPLVLEWHDQRYAPRHMRTFALLALFFAACTAPDSSTPTGPSFSSVHERLVHEPTRLFIPGEGSTGSLVASHYTSSGWVSGTANLTIDNGELVAKLSAAQQDADQIEDWF